MAGRRYEIGSLLETRDADAKRLQFLTKTLSLTAEKAVLV
jgi:hypothetical protein